MSKAGNFIDKLLFLQAFNLKNDKVHPLYRVWVFALTFLIIGLIFWIPLVALIGGLVWLVAAVFVYFFRNPLEIGIMKF